MARAPRDDDDVPWLAEGVRDEPATFVPRARLLGGGVVAVLLAVLVALGVYLAVGHKSDGSGGYARADDAPLIAADPGPYKVAPVDPGGAQITGIDDTIATVASGADAGSTVAPDVPEEPLTRPTPGAPPPTDLLPAAPAPAALRDMVPAPVVPPKETLARPPVSEAAPPPKAAAKPKPKVADPLAAIGSDLDATPQPRSDAPKPRADVAKPATAGTVTLQLGAFSSRDKAEAAWRKIGGDGALSGLTKRIEPVERDGTTLFRLRAGGVASATAARALCQRITAGGDACIVAS